MGFELDKQNVLSRLDKSKKGSVDKDILLLVNLLNSKLQYYTTSSCAGRIVLLSVPEENKKYNVEWLFLSHNIVNFKIIKDSLDKIIKNFDKNNIKHNIWFREESAIIHVCCKTIADASDLIEIAKHIGFKRSGINTIRKKIMLEIISTENMSVPVVKDGKLLVNDDYLKILVDEANKKLKRTKEKIEEFYKKLSSS